MPVILYWMAAEDVCVSNCFGVNSIIPQPLGILIIISIVGLTLHPGSKHINTYEDYSSTNNDNPNNNNNDDNNNDNTL